jgi:hypothetical protein
MDDHGELTREGKRRRGEVGRGLAVGSARRGRHGEESPAKFLV